MNQFSINQHQPELADDVYVAPGAKVMGKVRMAEKSSLWFNSVLRGDNEMITLGEETNFQDLSCLLYTSPSPRDGLLSRMPSSA